jgi:hypothetical protein
MITNPIKGYKNKKYPQGHVSQWLGENVAMYNSAIPILTKGHNGIDIVAPWGTPMYAVEDGLVCEVKTDPSGYGMHVRFLTGNKEDHKTIFHEWTYGHCSKIFVKVGDVIKAGQKIANMGNCFDKETEILTDSGWKKFADLDQTEFVATLNPDTQEIEYHKPESYTKKREKYMNYFRNYHSLDLAVTDNHTMYVELQDGEMHLKNFEDLPKFSWVKQNGGIWNGQEVNNFTIPETKFKFSKKKEELNIEMDSWLSFLGWFITDGSICNKNSVRITQSFNNAHKRKIIEEVLDNMPFEVKRYKEDYIIYSKQLADVLSSLCPNKTIPTFIFSLSSRQIRIFLDAFWLGDGWAHKTTKYYITPDKESADDLQELIMKCGGYAVIQKRDPLLVNRKKPAMIGKQEVISKNPYYIITEGQHRMGMIKKDMVERKEYNDFAYCLTVKNHIIYVRRNGRPMWCGNTGFVVSSVHADGLGYWVEGSNKYNGTHLHLGCREITYPKTDGWRYNTLTPKIQIENYFNGLAGGVDFKDWFYKEDLLGDMQILKVELEGYGDEPWYIRFIRALRFFNN